MSRVTTLPIEVENDDLLVYPESDLTRLDRYEANAYEHWVLGGSSGSLIGRVNGRVLTPQSDGVSYPNAHYLSMSGVQGKALLTDIEDTVTPTDTVAVVVRREEAAAQVCVLFGNMGLLSDVPPTGYSMFTAGGNSAWTRANGLDTGVNSTKTVPLDDWIFVAVSRSFGAGGNRIDMLIGGQGHTVRTPAGTYVPAPSGRKIALGSAYYNSGASALMDVAEFMIFDQALTAQAMDALYARAKARCAAVGITVV